MKILQRNRHTLQKIFLFISRTTNVLLFKSRCNILIGFRIIKEMPGLVGSGTPYIYIYIATKQTHTTDTFLFISRTTNVLLFKSRCNILIGFRIIKEMPGLVGSGTPCIMMHGHKNVKNCLFYMPLRQLD